MSNLCGSMKINSKPTSEESAMLRKNWLKKYEGTVSARDYRLLDKASRILMQNVVPQEENSLWNPYRGICPSYTKKQTKNQNFF